jgi:glutamate-ammonia-ligase adenylyltransferase
MNINRLIQEASVGTPDPGRALKNLENFLLEAPETVEEHAGQIGLIARLFAYSQFLADYSVKNPACLSRTLGDLSVTIHKEKILSSAREQYAAFRDEDRHAEHKERAMALLRRTKKDHLLLITLRDIAGLTDLNECTSELTALSEAITELALDMSYVLMRRKFGLMRGNDFSVIGMGKLGAGELNYSSDIDIITIYRSEESLSTGVLNPFGIRHNKISPYEYFCTLTEILTNLLQSPTEDGIAHRVDLRLRPNGQKGALSLSLDSYRSYYEAWGKTWERIALIRARPVAGDRSFGEKFLSAIEPFVWKRSMDYNDIEEVREMKKRIDTASDANDIKRGHGGIREIEFFVHTFQLLYGGEKTNLRKALLTGALGELLRSGLLPRDDVSTLSDSYIFLRRIEHILQMKDDMQVYSLPVRPEELRILARKMHFEDSASFSAGLKLKRLKVRDMYNSLLGGTDTGEDVILSLPDELPENLLLDYLSFRGFKNAGLAFKNVNALVEQISTGKTIRERTLLRKTIPAFLAQIIKSPNKDRALSMLVTFIQKTGDHESFIDLLNKRDDTKEIIIDTFSSSTYLTRSLLSLENLEGIFEYPDIRTDFRSLQGRLLSVLDNNSNPQDALREFKAIEELKSGLLFLKSYLDTSAFTHKLSMLADIIMRAVVRYLHMDKGFAVIGLGGFGARELNIGSDLDLLFISSPDKVNMHRENPETENRIADELIGFLSAYTGKGFAYKVDFRLRPDGSKGVLVNDMKGYENYYLRSAYPWEVQSLIRARPIAGDMKLLREFQNLRRRMIILRGPEITGSDIRNMRKRIVREVSRETSGYDLRNGPGGIKEVEFLVQYLQLGHASRLPDLIVHHTADALKRLIGYKILPLRKGNFLLSAYNFLKTVDTLLRLNEEDVLKTNSELADIISVFLKLGSGKKLTKKVDNTRGKVLDMIKDFY